MVQSPDTPDPWPERELNAEGFLLPNDAPGHTVTLLRPLPSKGILALLVLAALLFSKHFLGTTPWMTKAFGLLAVGILLLVADKYWPSPRKIKIERSRVLLWVGSSVHELSFSAAKTRLPSEKWGEIVLSRELGIMMNWRRAQLAVWEWLRHTQAGKMHRDKQGNLAATNSSKHPRLEFFAVDADGVRFLGEDIWVREKSSTERDPREGWLLDADKIRDSAFNAELVLITPTWEGAAGGYRYEKPPRYLAAKDADVSTIRAAIAEAGGRVLPGK